MRTKEIKLTPVRPNAGTTAIYRKRVDRLLVKMRDSYLYWLGASYKANEPAIMALDALPANELEKMLKKLGKRWQKEFDGLSDDLAKFFAKDVSKRTDAALKAILRKGGMSVSFKLTKAQQDIIQATINANVGLIRSIPKQFHKEVQGMVMRSVQTGRDLQQLTDDIQKRYGIERRKAIFIAKDQNSKATSALTAARQREVGIEEGIWRHSLADEVPRKKHLKSDGKRFRLDKGLPIGDKGQFVMPGEEINCTCYWQPIVAGYKISSAKDPATMALKKDALARAK